MNKKPLLAFDCACAGASITLQVGGQSLTRLLPQGKQAGALVPTIDALMREAQCAYTDLGYLISTIGPGSFTGLRIGLAALHGLSLVNQTPIKTITTLEAMAWSVVRMAGAPSRFVTVLNAGKGELCAQEFQLVDGTPKAVGEVYLTAATHDAWPAPAYGNHVAADSPFYLAGADTEILCDIAHLLPEATLAQALPFYIRPPDAIIPKAHAWLGN